MQATIPTPPIDHLALRAAELVDLLLEEGEQLADGSLQLDDVAIPPALVDPLLAVLAERRAPGRG